MTMSAQLGNLLTAAALCVVLGSNVAQLQQARGSLQTAVANQRTALANAVKIEIQLDALARGTQALAARGNTDAAKIVNILKANGVSIKAG